MVEIRTHWPTSIGLGGLYLFLLSAVKISENLIDVDIFLDKRVMAIGNGLAYSYYYGFLKIILPAGINKSKSSFQYQVSVCIFFMSMFSQ